METDSPKKLFEQIDFDNGAIARLVHASQSENPAGLIEILELHRPHGIILLCGGADNLDTKITGRLELLFNRGIARAAAQSGSYMIDGGTQSGVMALMGKAVAEREDNSVLIGIAPEGKVRYPGYIHAGSDNHSTSLESHHTHFILVEGNVWGSETRLMFDFAEWLSKGYKSGEEDRSGVLSADATTTEKSASGTARDHAPVVLILVGGNSHGVAVKEVQQAVRKNWPVIVLEGSGGLADELAGAVRQGQSRIMDSILSEIVEEGNLHLISIHHSPGAFLQLVLWHLGNNDLLTLAWKRYGIYSTQAKRQQSRFQRLQKLILWLGVITTLFVVVKSVLQVPDWSKGLTFISANARQTLVIFGQSIDPLLYIVVLVLPILTSAVIVIAARMNAGNKWVLLRSSAEAVKRQIYLYRTLPLTGQPAVLNPLPGEEAVQGAVTSIVVSDDGKTTEDGTGVESDQVSRENELYHKLEQLDQELMQSDVVTSALPEYTDVVPPRSVTKRGDDGRSLLTPQRYIYLRLDEQLEYYRKNSLRLERQGQRLQWWAIGIGALGTFLAAVGLVLWVALTTAIVTAVTAYLHYEQTENKLVRYNHAASNLDNIKMWWASLSTDARADPQNVRRMVETTERILEEESRSWLQQMRDALANLSKQPSGDYTGSKPSGE